MSKKEFITTLNKINKLEPCEDRLNLLLKKFNKSQPDNEEISIKIFKDINNPTPWKLDADIDGNFFTIGSGCGVSDALFCLMTVENREKDIRSIMCDIAEIVLPIYEKNYPKDINYKPRKCIEVSRRFANEKVKEPVMELARKEIISLINPSTPNYINDILRSVYRAAHTPPHKNIILCYRKAKNGYINYMMFTKKNTTDEFKIEIEEKFNKFVNSILVKYL